MKYLHCIFLMTVAAASAHDLRPIDNAVQASMIWAGSDTVGYGSYTVFRKTFELADTTSPMLLRLFADSRYLLWINGRYVLRGPCRFNPQRPEYDIVDCSPFLKKGKNVAAILVHNYGGALNGRIMKHRPGLGAVLESAGGEILRTDSTWRYNTTTRYRPSPGSWNTVPDVIDGRIDTCEWATLACDDRGWPRATAIDGGQWGTMHERGIAMQRETELTGLRLLPSRQEVDAALPIELTAGRAILVDMGRMSLAYTTIVLDADAGSVLTMQYALRYVNGTPGEMYGAGNTYTARAGLQQFMTTDQWSGRYVQVTCTSGRVRLLGITMTDRRYPFERVGSFAASDTMLTTLWDMCLKTIEVTSDDGYGSDARERNEWIQDASKPSYQTTRVGDAAPGAHGARSYADPRLLKNMLRHATLAQLPDGRLPATFPTDRGPEDCHHVIDDYSCQWCEALNTYYDATGDTAFVREMFPVLEAQIEWLLSRRTERGLLLAREYASFDNPLAYITCEGATINAFTYMALKASAYLATAVGEHGRAMRYATAAGELRTAFTTHLWNETEGVYNSAWRGGTVTGPTVHAQLLALSYGLVPDDRIACVRSWFIKRYTHAGMKHVCKNPDVEAMIAQQTGIDMPVMYHWVFNELYRMDTDEADREALSEMRRRWSPMVTYMQDAGTLPESFTDEKGEGASESCHNYGAIPASFLSSFVLGVRRDGPVWEKRLLIEPRLGDLLSAEGDVVTEYGPVRVSWKRSADGLSLAYAMKLPDGIRTEIHFPNVSAACTISLNGRTVVNRGVPSANVGIVGRWFVVRDVFGECSGTVAAQ